MFSLIILVLFALVAALIYLFLVWNFDYWRKRNVNGPKPRPLLGNFPNLLTQKQHFGDDFNDIYKKYKSSENYVGIFLMRSPQLMLLNPAMAHEVFVTAFKHFQDNDLGKMIDKKKDPLLANNPFLLAGQKWKDQRTMVSPGMTSSRIKVAYSIMQEVCHTLCKFIQQSSKEGINGKELALRFTCENVSDSVLGIKANSFTNHAIPIADNVRKFGEDNTVFFIYTLIAGICPSIVNIFKVKFLPKDCESFFLDLMKRAFVMRASSAVERQDFLNHLLSLQGKKHLSDTELASHAMTFLIDGLETTATVISHCLLLLAREPKAQDKLREEILQNLDDSGELSFEKLNELPYLDACLHESLRIFPPGLWTTKICTEPYEFTNKDGQKLQVGVGEVIMIPIYGYHMDPTYYSEPERFEPERFMPENGGLKKYRDMGVFLGFGDGPRMCLGMRFAQVQSKAAISSIVKSFNIKVNPKTAKENKLDPKAFLALQKGGVWLDFEQLVNQK